MKTMIGYVLAACLLAVTAQRTSISAEAEAKKPAPAAVKKAKASVPTSFRGNVAAMDKAAMTFTVGEKAKTRTIHITSRTRITKAGKPATSGEVTVGEAVSGQAIKNATGEEEAVAVRLGAKLAAKPATKKPQKADGRKKK